MIQHGDHVVDHLDDYLHELLGEADAEYVREHAGSCAICRMALDEAQRRRMLLAGVVPAEPSEALIERTIERVRQQRARRSNLRRAAWRTYLVGMAAAVVVAAVLHLYFATLSPTPYDLRIIAQGEMMSDTPASLRAVVVRGDNGSPVPNARVRIDLFDPQTRHSVQLAAFRTDQRGTGEPRFRLPDWKDGSYELRITADPGRGRETITRSITLRRSWKLMLSSDKPAYQPGQAMHFRALALRQPDLRPVAGQEALFTVTDPKGNVIFKQRGVTSRFGITSADCELADEIIEGAYNVACRIGDTESRQTVEVKRYVLPKFRVDLEADGSYYQPGERMRVTVSSAYFFGKPVAGAIVEAEVRDGGAPRRMQTQTAADGTAQLDVPIPATLPGRPQDSGDARVHLDLLVRDPAGQEQRRTLSRIVTTNPLRVEIIPESGELTRGVANRVYLITTYADGTPASARIAISGRHTELRTNDLGVASFELTPREENAGVTVRATDDRGLTTTNSVLLRTGESTRDFIFRTDKAVYRGGETIEITVIGGGAEPVFLDLIRDGQTLLTQTLPITDGRGGHAIDLPADLFGTIEIIAYRMGAEGLAVRKSRVIYVEAAQQLKLELAQDRPEYRPGETATLQFALTDESGEPAPGALSLAAVDEAVFSVLDQAPGMERSFFTLEQELLEPIYAIYDWSPDLERSDREAQRVELEKALFARATAQMSPRSAGARAIQRAVERGELDRRLLEVLDRPDVDQLLDQMSFDARLLGQLRAAAVGPVFVSTYPEKVRATSERRHRGLRQMSSAWWTIGAIGVIGLLVWIAGGRVMTVLILLFVGGFLVSIMLPSLNRARETADRVKAASDLRQLGQAMAMEGAIPMAATGEPTSMPRLRQWFPETLLWRPELITDDAGRASLDLSLADSITTWRLSASAVSADGRLGALQSGIRVFQPFFVDLSLPVALVRNDEIAVPVAVYNYLDQPQTIELNLVRQGDWFELLDEPFKRIELAAGEVSSVSYRMRVTRVGRHELQVQARGSTGVADAIQRTIDVISDGRVVEQVINGTLQQPLIASLALPPAAIDGSERLIVKIYPSSFSQLVEGLDGIFQRPYGCFEQTSSTTYPNILALSYLQETGTSAPEVEATARQYIHLGYQRLVSFEVPGGGFDWFGRPPANVVLTAYGLMQFQDMRKVHDVDPQLIERTRRWLLAQRRPDGSWSAGRMLNDGLGQSVRRGADPDLATTAYVAWAVYGGENSADALTLNYLRRQSIAQIDDPYILAVLANALLALDPQGGETAAAVDRLVQLRFASPDGKQAWWTQPDGSRTHFYGGGDGSAVETTALATLALIRDGREPVLVRSALSWLVAQRDARGTWPSTQATVLALKALLAGTGKPLGGDDARVIELRLGDDVVRSIEIPADQAEVMRQVDLSSQLRRGGNSLTIAEQTSGASGYQVAFRYNVPGEAPRDDDRPLAIDVSYDRTELAVGQSITATASVVNQMRQAAPMMIVDLPIPAGFAVDPADFEQMVSGGTIARYQLTPRNVIVYLRSLSPGQPLRLRYRLEATMPVTLTVPPAQVYEYYDPSKRAESSPQRLHAAAGI